MENWIVLIVSALIPSLLFVPCAELLPRFTAAPPDPFYVLEGNNITFVWQYNLSGAFDRVIFKFVSSSSSRIIVFKRNLNIDAAIPDSDFQGRIQENINATRAEITIFESQRSESGQYEIEVADSNLPASDRVTVQVQYPPEFNSFSSDVVVVEGDPSVTLECIADGEPTPNITWTKVYTNGNDSGVLGTGNQFVLETNRNNSGRYRCTAYNGIGTAPNRTVKVEVNFKPENVKLMVNDSVVCIGDVISITCSAAGKPAVHTYQLFENETPVNDENSSAGVWIRKYLKEGDFSYRCVANNTVGTTEKTVNVTVKVPSKVHFLENITVVEGENRTLTCYVSGSPKQTVTWTEVRSSNQSKGVMRYFTNISRNNAGEYKCEATNDCGDSSTSTFLTVLYKPEKFNFTVSKSAVCQGSVIAFNCSAYGTPPVDTYELLENGVSVRNGYNNLGMWSRNMLTGGVFNYKCMAKNSAGTAYSMTVTVTVNGVQAIDNKTVTEGANVTLTCQTYGGSFQRLTWFKPDGQSGSKTVLELVNISRNEAGEYRCEVHGECGNETETVNIDVQYKPETVDLKKSSFSSKNCRGDIISFNCSADANPLVTSYQLFENETAILDTNPSGMWNRKLQTGGVFMYKCMANNYLGSEDSLPVIVEVNVPSSIPALQDQSAIEGDNVTLLCSVSGMPLPLVSWMTPNSQRQSGYMLKLTSINRSQAGEYKCEASNECGNATRTASIHVQFKLPDSVTVHGPVPSEPAKVNKDAIYGSVIGVLAFMFAVSIIFIAWKRRKPEKDDRLDSVLKESRRPHFNEGIELENFNGNPSTVVHHGPGHYMDLSEVRSLNEPAMDPARSYLEINEYAPLHPGTRSWEVERQDVIIEKVIGKGAFGQVAQGKASNLQGREETITVAIKMLKGNATDAERKDLLSELEVMKKLKPHPHVIRLLGCVTESDPLLVLIEYVPYGDLLGYLRKSRHLEDNYFKDPDIKPQTSLTSQQLMKFSWQVADGMHYLSSKNIIHRDLAARNVLVGERERCKVTDFGMARDVCQENIYERKSKGRLPVKWTACEALLYGRYTTKSDVWSFGIVLYEIFTIGGSPYPKIPGRKMADLLTQGYRMPKPRHVDDTLYKIMQDCWQETPDDRPMFENMRNDLKEMENQHQRLINMKHYDNILYTGMD